MGRAWIAVAEVVAGVRSPSIQDIDVHRKVLAHMQAAERGPRRTKITRDKILPFETPADAAYGMLRTRLGQTGRPIGANDLLIAAQALAFPWCTSL
jgi:predicted nucleic acid-binding protein